MREVVGGALASIVGEVEGLGGNVTSLSSTGVLVVFGAPEAHEDDPERALRAAYRVVNGTSTLSGEVALRAGVETGPVVTGPIYGGAGGHYGVVGDVVNIAGALQLASRPASVLVGPMTRAAAEGLFGRAPQQRWRFPEGLGGCPPPTSGGPGHACPATRPDGASPVLRPSSAVGESSTFFGSPSTMRLPVGAASSS